MKFKVVQVVWEDAHGGGGGRGPWMTPEELKADIAKPMLVTSVGLLLHRDKHKLVLGSTVSHDGLLADVCSVPTGMVRSFKRLATVEVPADLKLTT